MNKGIIAAIVVFIVVVGGGYYAWSKGLVPGRDTPPTTASFRELAASTAPQECSFSADGGGKGTLYIASGMIRGDFETQIGEKPTSGHVILRDKTSYLWMDGQSSGFKNSLEATTTSGENTVSYDDRVTYECKPWTPDQGRFTVPSDVTFKDLTGMQVQAAAAASSSVEGKVNTCAQCDMIPNDEAKRQCRAALSC